MRNEAQLSRRRVFLIDHMCETDSAAKEITMVRIERVQRGYEICAQGGDLHARGSFDSPALPDSAPSAPGENFRLHSEVRENGDGQVFASHRARLFAIAYRMLGSRADAEDLVQDVYLRWHESARCDIESPIAFLVTITTRLCLDRLRELKRRRAQCPGHWLPEPVVEDHMPSPEMQLAFSEEVSIGFLAVLERLGSEERAAFLLHDVFDYDYQEVGKILSKTESACRQMIHRARARLRGSRARFAVTQESRERVLRKFVAAIGTGDRRAILALLAEEVECMALGSTLTFSSAHTTGASKGEARTLVSGKVRATALRRASWQANSAAR